MKRISANRIAALAATISATLLLTAAHAGVPSPAPFDTVGTPVQTAGLVWRCGKNNPASWGTFGNGCLKQKRAARRNAAIVGPDLSQSS